MDSGIAGDRVDFGGREDVVLTDLCVVYVFSLMTLIKKALTIFCLRELPIPSMCHDGMKGRVHRHPP